VARDKRAVTADGQVILAAAALLAAGLVASLLAERFRFPALVLVLGIGMAVGSDGLGWIPFGLNPADYDLALFVGTIALAAILFEAGLGAGYAEIRPVLRPAIGLATVGTAATAAVTGLAATWLFDLPLLHGLLLGAILAASDGAAVFALLRGSQLRQRLARTLEGEAGLNDPIAVLLVLGLVELVIHPETGALDLVLLFGQELAIGCAVGLGVAWLMSRVVRGADFAPPAIHLLGSATALALAYGGAAAIGGSGFLAVYLAGLAFGRVPESAEGPIKAFHLGLAQVAEIVLFLALGLLVFPAQFGDVLAEALVLAVVLAFVARPVAVALATALDRYSLRERVVLGWAGLRGAVPVVLALLPVVAGVPGAIAFLNLAFFAVLVSTLVQGATVEPLARRLGLTGEGGD
jgi:potassium/hydrogen antiporter